MPLKLKYLSILAFCVLLLVGCSFSNDKDLKEKIESKQGTGFLLTGPGSFDSADTAIITKIDSLQSQITFFNIKISKKYTLNYDGATKFSDKYGQAMSLPQIEEGDIVDITFLKSKKRLDTLKISADAWENNSASRYEINMYKHDVTIGKDTYKITSDTLIFSDGQQVDIMDLNSVDILTFQGIETTVYSIIVEKGHGYLRLANDENFIGGWIEVGQSLIKEITEDMLLTVPEGKYDVLISQKGSGGKKSVIINRGEEITLDIGDLKVAEPQYGQVLFAVTPSTAGIYIDGAKVDVSTAVNLEYGIHQLIAVASGYKTITSYFRVTQASMGIEVTLESESAGSTNETDNTDEKSSTDNTTATSYYQVHIDSPEKVEVYVDGNYVGISPISFKKVEGAHIITLRKTGYETRSYTIQVDSEEKDVSFSFADLVASINE